MSLYELPTAPPYALPDAEVWGEIEPEQVQGLLRAVLSRHGITGGGCARMLRTDPKKVREWIGGKTHVPYPHWYVLLDKINRLESAQSTTREPAL